MLELNLLYFAKKKICKIPLWWTEEKFPNSISVWLFIQCVNVILNLLIFRLKDKRKSACNNKWCDNFSYFAWSKQVKYVQLKFIILKTQWIVYEAICWVKCFIELDIKRTIGDRMVNVTSSLMNALVFILQKYEWSSPEIGARPRRH